MSIGEYTVTILDADGNPTQTEIERTSHAARPLVGEEIEIDDVLYRVVGVRHCQEEQRTVRVYTRPRVFVRVIVRGRLH